MKHKTQEQKSPNDELLTNAADWFCKKWESRKTHVPQLSDLLQGEEVKLCATGPLGLVNNISVKLALDKMNIRNSWSLPLTPFQFFTSLQQDGVSILALISTRITPSDFPLVYPSQNDINNIHRGMYILYERYHLSYKCELMNMKHASNYFSPATDESYFLITSGYIQLSYDLVSNQVTNTNGLLLDYIGCRLFEHRKDELISIIGKMKLFYAKIAQNIFCVANN